MQSVLTRLLHVVPVTTGWRVTPAWAQLQALRASVTWSYLGWKCSDFTALVTWSSSLLMILFLQLAYPKLTSFSCYLANAQPRARP